MNQRPIILQTRLTPVQRRNASAMTKTPFGKIQNIGQLTIEHVFGETETPILFIAKDTTGKRYLCNAYEKTQYTTRYLIIPTAKNYQIRELITNPTALSRIAAFNDSFTIVWDEEDNKILTTFKDLNKYYDDDDKSELDLIFELRNIPLPKLTEKDTIEYKKWLEQEQIRTIEPQHTPAKPKKRKDYAYIICDKTGEIYWTGKGCTYQLRKARLYASEQTANIALSKTKTMNMTVKKIQLSIHL